MKMRVLWIAALMMGLTFATYAQCNDRPRSSKKYHHHDRSYSKYGHHGQDYYTRDYYGGHYVRVYEDTYKNRLNKYERKRIKHMKHDLEKMKKYAWRDGFISRREHAAIRAQERAIQDYLYHARHKRYRRF